MLTEQLFNKFAFVVFITKLKEDSYPQEVQGTEYINHSDTLEDSLL